MRKITSILLLIDFLSIYCYLLIKAPKGIYMNDTTDVTTLSVRMLIFVVIAGIFYFVLKSKK